jgi:hypothetical protein
LFVLGFTAFNSGYVLDNAKILREFIQISTTGVNMAKRFSSQKQPRLLKTIMLIGVVAILSAFPSYAAFSSGSDGSDGALEITVPGRTIFNPAMLGIDSDRDNVFNFTTINIAVGCTLRLGADIMGARPVAWLASGNVTINGVVDLNGENGHAYNAAHRPSIAGAGGYGGGVGVQTGVTIATPGEGPGGGGAGNEGGNINFFHGAGAGYKNTGGVSGTGSGYAIAGKAYGNKYLLPLMGGSGGGGGIYYSGYFGAGGGAGGGAILIASSGTIQLNGNVMAKGGNSGSSSQYCKGGCGSGGGIRVVTNTISGSGVIDVSGGSVNGNVGSQGYIRLEAYTNTLSNSNMLPNATYGTPGLPLFPAPGSIPGVKIVTIDGITVPVNPNGSYTLPDVTINRNDTSTIIIKAQLVPVGTAVTLTMNSENEGTFTFTSPALTGTLDSSSTTVRTKIPPGYSRLMLNASW